MIHRVSIPRVTLLTVAHATRRVLQMRVVYRGSAHVRLISPLFVTVRVWPGVWKGSLAAIAMMLVRLAYLANRVRVSGVVHRVWRFVERLRVALIPSVIVPTVLHAATPAQTGCFAMTASAVVC